MYFNLIVCLIFVFFVLIAQFSVIYAFKRLMRKGVTHDARKSFVKKHILYVGVFLLTWSSLLINNYKALYNFNAHTDHGSFYGDTNLQDYISYILLAGNGILLTLVRLQDPYYQFKTKQMIYENFGIVLNRNRKGIES